MIVLVVMIAISVSASYAATTPIKIMPVGDSVTAGIGSTGQGSYRTDLYKLYTNAGLSIDFVGSQSNGPSSLPDKNHEGHSGWVISQIASNVNSWLNTYNPDVMLLMIGGNDTLAGTVPTTALGNLIDQITNQKPNLTLFVADYYYSLPSNANYQLIVQYDAAIPGLVQQKANAGKHVYFVKLSDANLATSEYADGLHPTDSGYSKLATIWNRDTTSIIKSLVGGATPTPTQPGGPTPTPTQPGGPTPTPISGTVSINAGGSATGSFTADQYYSGGTAYTTTNTIDTSQVGSVPAAVFQSERYGAFSYTIPNRSGAQTVTLYFAETYLTAAGQRLFNVSINGATVLNSFDIYASAGGQNKAIAKTFNTTANSSGQVVIQLTTGTENPKINGITVASGTAGPTNTPNGPTATRTPTIGASSTPTTGPSLTSTRTPTPGASLTPGGPTPTRTITLTPGSGSCSPVTATITAPFTQDGAGTFCWQASTLGAYLNSWNTTSVSVNGTNYTNLYVAVGSLPAKINGFWYISYNSTVSWGHFEAK
jgi:lysophospholipase L1-like esterase